MSGGRTRLQGATIVMSFLSFKRSPSKKQLQEDALTEARRKVEIEKIRQQEEEEEEKRQKADEVLTSYKQPRPMEVNPPRSRLNPKLTRRALPPDYEDLPSDDRSKPKTAAKLSHNGWFIRFSMYKCMYVLMYRIFIKWSAYVHVIAI